MGCSLLFGNFSKSTCIRVAGDGRDSLIQDFALGGFSGKKEPIGGFKDRPSRPSPDEKYLLRIRMPFHEAAAGVIFLESTCTDLHIAKVCRSRRS